MPWAAEKKSPSKKTAASLQNQKIPTAALQIKRRYEVHPRTQTTSWCCIVGHTPTPTHTNTLLVASKHHSAALPTQRWWCMRWNVCASAVRSCPCGAFRTTNTTHTKHISLRCALGCRKKIPFQKNRRVLTKPNNSNDCASNHTALRTTPWHANNLTAHTAHPLFLSLVGYNLAAHTALLGVALDLLRLCCSILPVWSAVSACGGDCGILSLAGSRRSSSPPRAVGVCYEPLRSF